MTAVKPSGNASSVDSTIRVSQAPVSGCGGVGTAI